MFRSHISLVTHFVLWSPKLCHGLAWVLRYLPYSIVIQLPYTKSRLRNNREDYFLKGGKLILWSAIGIMTTPPLLDFYKSILDGAGGIHVRPCDVEIVVADPASMGPKRGIVIDQKRSPTQLGHMKFSQNPDKVWVIRILRSFFPLGHHFKDQPFCR